MFENVRRRLVDALEDAVPDFDRESFYYFAAAMVASEYLRKNFTNPKVSDFLDLKITSRGGISWRHSMRVILIGETLFMLRSASGFSEVCRRMRIRDFRSTYFELYAARMFFEGGFDIVARPEVGIRGQDFDFQAANKDEVINVEVTALTPNDFSSKTIENALQQKRKQLPNTAPGVIFCALPETWNKRTRHLDIAIREIVKNFFGQTKRIAAVVFLHEEHIDLEKDGSTGYLFVLNNCFLHTLPRHSIGSWKFLGQRPDVVPTVASTQRRDSEFFPWADAIFSARFSDGNG